VAAVSQWGCTLLVERQQWVQGVMVVWGAAFGFCYSCATVAVSTRRVIFEKEVVVEKVAFIFGTSVTGGK